MLKRVEGDNADRIVELAGQKVVDDGFQISPLDFGLAVNGAATKAVDDEIGSLIRPIRYDLRRPSRSGHNELH